ncbi:RluA family pseudouridine synthase [Ruminiclostridium cellobioparum]|uniref:Pseudouridine synthase n=1 Tax=Ruminiclostridium cellobioparum subsp. termitidis CT1112 TaxID=1195236 RepID=S0FTC1_RUMCE|nr:RluA family pseudouridine synthase [Ruminiclostridium cellobioparum]EMS71753.1 pseudouridine synthase, RluA family [Ruminiclostridium cellobioparum subsp. termitidis CT1112]
MKEIILECDENSARIDAWLAGKLEEYSRSYIQKLCQDGHITVDGVGVKSNYRLKTGERITALIPEAEVLQVTAEEIPLDIVYEDEHIIVINKPKGMVVHPAAGNYTGTLVNALMKHCGESLSDINGIIRPGIVHRIDKDTSGLLVVAKNNHAHEFLSKKLKTHDIKREYIALVEGIIYESTGKIDAPIGRHPVERKKMSVNVKSGRNAVTHFKVLDRFPAATYLELKLETGRTHQIRVHMAYINHPVIGDEVYGRKKQRFDTRGQVLHARRLTLEHPATGELMEFEVPVPDYFTRLIQELKEVR